MGWFDGILKKINRKTTYASMLNGYTPIFSNFGNDIYASDVVQQALECIISEMKKLTPVHVRYSNGDPVPIYDDVQKVLDNPNQIMTKSSFIEKMMWILFLDYNAFAIPVYDVWIDKDGKEKRNYRAIYPVRPCEVSFIEDESGTLFVKMRFINNHETTLPYSDVIHLRYRYSVNEFMGGDETGRPDHKSILKTLQLNHNLLEGVSSAMKSSFAINGVVKYNTMMDKGKTEAALKELEENLETTKAAFCLWI